MEWTELLVAAIAGGLITQLVSAFKARADSQREDRKQEVEADTSTAAAARALTEASTTVVKLQDEQIDEFRQQIRALQSESAAMNTRLDREIQRRLRAEAMTGSIEQQVNLLRDQLSIMQARAEMNDQARQLLLRDNEAMKAELFKLSVGAAALIRQVREAGLEPAYLLEVQPIDEGRTQPLGELR